MRSDFHLFDELPDTNEAPAERDAAAQAALERLGLAHERQFSSAGWAALTFLSARTNSFPACRH